MIESVIQVNQRSSIAGPSSPPMSQLASQKEKAELTEWPARRDVIHSQEGVFVWQTTMVDWRKLHKNTHITKYLNQHIRAKGKDTGTSGETKRCLTFGLRHSKRRDNCTIPGQSRCSGFCFSSETMQASLSQTGHSSLFIILVGVFITLFDSMGLKISKAQHGYVLQNKSHQLRHFLREILMFLCQQTGLLENFPEVQCSVYHDL